MTSLSVKATVVIPNWNGRYWLEGCLNALNLQDYQNFEIIVVDDASTDNSVEYVEREFPGVEVIRQRRRHGFAKSVNVGIKAASGEYVILLNNDTVPSATFISKLVHAMETMPADVGSLASCMRNMDQPTLVDDTGDILTWYGQALKRGHGKPVTEFSKNSEVFSACAGAALYRNCFLKETGGFDERYVNYLEDVDLGLRGRLAGYRCWFVAGADVLHKGHGSNIPGGDYVRYLTRNRLLLIGKNIPTSLIIRHIHHLLAGQLALFIQHKRPLDSIVGFITFFPLIPYVMREKHRARSRTTLDRREIENLLLLSHEGISLPGWMRYEEQGG